MNKRGWGILALLLCLASRVGAQGPTYPPAIFQSTDCAAQPTQLTRLCVQGTVANAVLYGPGPAGFYVPLGSVSVTTTQTITETRDPETTDNTYAVGSLWTNTTPDPDTLWILVSLVDGVATWTQVGTDVNNNLTATTAPTSDDDLNASSPGPYSIGSRWLNILAGVEYVATDVTDGAAVWIQTSSTAGDVVSSADCTSQAVTAIICAQTANSLDYVLYIATSAGYQPLVPDIVAPSMQVVGDTGATYVGTSPFKWCPSGDTTQCFQVRNTAQGLAMENLVSDVVETWQDYCYANDTRAMILGDATTAWSTDCDTGVVTYTGTARPAMTTTFDASAFNAISGNACVLSTAAVNSGATRPIAYCTDADTGQLTYEVQSLPATYATDDPFEWCLKATSITNQSGLTLLFDHAVVCVSDNEAEPAVPAAGDLNRITLTFGNQANDNQGPVCVTITPSGCAAGDRMIIYINSDDSLTATQSAATAFLTGGSLTLYKATSR